MPLNEVFCAAANGISASEATRGFIKHEMCFISSLFNQHTADIFVEGINSSGNRLIIESDKVMDKYRKNYNLYVCFLG